MISAIHQAAQSAQISSARAARILLLSVTAETVLTILHFLHGVRIYDDPGRLHVVVPALVSLVIVAALSGVLLWRPRKLTLIPLALATMFPSVAMFGIFHGLYGHVLKLILFFAGASKTTLERLFMSPDYVLPDNFVFELGGVLTFVAGAVVFYWLVRLFRLVWGGAGPGLPPAALSSPNSGAQPPSSVSQPAGGCLRLVGLALSMLLDAPFKSLGTLIGVVVSVFLMAQQTSVLMGILSRVTSLVDKSGADIWIASLATESTDATDTIPASKVGAAAGTAGVAWAAPVVRGIGKVTRPDGVRENVKVIGVQAPRCAGLPRTLAAGTTPGSLRGSGRILLNWSDRPTFAAAEPGDRVEINGRVNIVAGFFEGVDPHDPFYYVFANVDDARSLTGFPQDRVTFIAVGTVPGERVNHVKARLEARIPNALVRTRAEMLGMEEQFFLVRTPVGVVFGMGTVVAALIGAAIVAVTLYSTAIDRARDYGTLKAIGATRRDILQLLFVQAWIYAAAGYVVGMVAFYIVRHHVTEISMVSPPKLVLGVAVAALLSCTFASLAAVKRVLSLDPAIVFKG